MTKKPYLQFVRTLFIVLTLVGFSASNLVACMCAAKKKAQAGFSHSAKAQVNLAKACCKAVPPKKVPKKPCCKKLCCVKGRRQDSILECNQEVMALADVSGVCSIHLQATHVPDMPLYQVAFAGPCIIELCVFLC
jgi:hypothetical protein